ncbi:MAG: hypothetical protein JKY37_19795 [Nannocystaceae bacterium]|nr:hypothetical protein [Nannocystaceae bacterium]
MTELDELERMWATEHAKLARRVSHNEALLRSVTAQRQAPSLRWGRGTAVAGVALAVASVVGLAIFASRHSDSPALLASALAVTVFASAIGLSTARWLVLVRQLDLAGPVASSQRVLESLALADYRSLKIALLGGVLLWVPVLAVVVAAAFNIDLFAHLPVAWVAGNLLLGAAVIAGGQWLSRRYVDGPHITVWTRRVLAFVSGRSVTAARNFVAELETPTPG